MVENQVLSKLVVSNSLEVKKKCLEPFNLTKNPICKRLLTLLTRNYWKRRQELTKKSLKLILNSAFDKTYGSVLNHSHFDVVTNSKECAQIIEEPNNVSFTIIDTNIILLHKNSKYYFEYEYCNRKLYFKIFKETNVGISLQFV